MVYNNSVMFKIISLKKKKKLIIERGTIMTISEQIRILCVRQSISVSELARRIGTSPQNFNAKLRRESFTVADLELIAEVTGTEFERKFILENGESV